MKWARAPGSDKMSASVGLTRAAVEQRRRRRICVPSLVLPIAIGFCDSRPEMTADSRRKSNRAAVGQPVVGDAATTAACVRGLGMARPTAAGQTNETCTRVPIRLTGLQSRAAGGEVGKRQQSAHTTEHGGDLRLRARPAERSQLTKHWS